MRVLMLLAIAFTAVSCANENTDQENVSTGPTLHGILRGSEGVGGGDICEARIQEISTDLKVWILAKGHLQLALPEGISVDDYAQKMTVAINTAKNICVSEGDEKFPVQVLGTPKVCKFEVDSSDMRIYCDLKKFKALTEEQQYSLIHHEYAGLGGIENPKADSSDYTISKQISAILENQIVKKLAVKRSAEVGESYVQQIGAIPNKSVFLFGDDFILPANDNHVVIGSVSNSSDRSYRYFAALEPIYVSHNARRLKKGTVLTVVEVRVKRRGKGLCGVIGLAKNIGDREVLNMTICSGRSDYLPSFQELNSLLKSSINSEILVAKPSEF